MISLLDKNNMSIRATIYCLYLCYYSRMFKKVNNFLIKNMF